MIHSTLLVCVRARVPCLHPGTHWAGPKPIANPARLLRCYRPQATRALGASSRTPCVRCLYLGARAWNVPCPLPGGVAPATSPSPQGPDGAAPASFLLLALLPARRPPAPACPSLPAAAALGACFLNARASQHPARLSGNLAPAGNSLPDCSPSPCHHCHAPTSRQHTTFQQPTAVCLKRTCRLFCTCSSSRGCPSQRLRTAGRSHRLGCMDTDDYSCGVHGCMCGRAWTGCVQ
jgi:hypothetical protein